MDLYNTNFFARKRYRMLNCLQRLISADSPLLRMPKDIDFISVRKQVQNILYDEVEEVAK